MKEMCSVFKLPNPYPGEKLEFPTQVAADSSSGGRSLTLPRQLRREELWICNGRSQFEFIVDNQTLASLANIEMSIGNPVYTQDIHSIRDGLRHFFKTHFDPKGGFLSPVEWRPREFNSPPDTVCHMVADAEPSLVDLDMPSVVQALRQGCSLQIHCDGGFNANRGAASYVVHAIAPHDRGLTRMGYAGLFMDTARSAFHAEVTALATAVKWLVGVADGFPCHSRRVRFMNI